MTSTPITPITLTLWQWIIVTVGATLVMLTLLITTTVSTRLLYIREPQSIIIFAVLLPEYYSEKKAKEVNSEGLQALQTGRI